MTNCRALAIAVALGGLVAGCRDEPVLPAGLAVRAAQAALTSEREEYYLAGAVKVQLRRVPGRYVLETADGASLSRVSQLLVGRGAGLRIVDELAVPGHRVVELGGGRRIPQQMRRSPTLASHSWPHCTRV